MSDDKEVTFPNVEQGDQDVPEEASDTSAETAGTDPFTRDALAIALNSLAQMHTALNNKMSNMSTHFTAPKLPEFDSNDPELWFSRLESEFTMATPSVTDGPKRFAYASSRLSATHASAIADLIREEPRRPDIYQRFRQRMVDTYGPSETKRASNFMDYPDLGDGSAVEMAANMLQCLPPSARVPHPVLRETFLRKIPTDLCNSLGKLTDEDLDLLHLGKRVDDLKATRASGTAVNTVKTSGTKYKNKKRKTEAKDDGKNGVKLEVTPHPDWCFYHEKFGKKAERCRPPCTFSPHLQETEIQGN